jgi:hypothetical protein
MPSQALEPAVPAADGVHPPNLSAAELALFWEQGFVKLGRVVPLDTIERMCARVDKIMLGDLAYPDMSFMLCPSAVDIAEVRGLSCVCLVCEVAC